MTLERAARCRRSISAAAIRNLKSRDLSKKFELVERLRKVGARAWPQVLAEVAIAWVLRHSAVSRERIVGARNARQAEGVMRAGELKLARRKKSRKLKARPPQPPRAETIRRRKWTWDLKAKLAVGVWFHRGNRIRHRLRLWRARALAS
jgi:hypothetical protein